MEAPALRPIVLLPGAILPAEIEYKPLLEILQKESKPFIKDLAVYAGDAPPPDYGLDQEVESLRKAVNEADFQSFDLVGYSAGGTVALTFIAAYPEKVRSLTLIEPDILPSQEWIQEAKHYLYVMEGLMRLPAFEQMVEYMRMRVRPGIITPPQLGEQPWMAKRPAGLRAIWQSFVHSEIRADLFRRFQKPVYLAIGSLSDGIEERKAGTLSMLFSDFQVEVYKGLHHFNPPHRAEPERFSVALRRLWNRADLVHV
jgi:pimeloyl-ACP methyl ester carboxylesterase